MTFSIVAADRTANEVGFAIASCCWDAGQVCFAKAEQGAIASQAQGNLDFLPAYFEQLQKGRGLDDILETFRAMDENVESRQIGMVTADGEAVSFTGSECSAWAGHRTGAGYACQGNILAGSQVVQAMAEAFEGSEGPLYRRLYDALAAGDRAGGDLRGRQSARLMVMKRGWGQPGTDTLIDLSLPDHEHPVAEIGRILKVRGHLVTILGLLRDFEEASPEAKVDVLGHLRRFLDDKRSCRFLDWWETLADKYFGMGEVEASIEAYQVYLSINPALAPVLRAGLESSGFPADRFCDLF